MENVKVDDLKASATKRRGDELVDFGKGPLVMLFYDGYEVRAKEGLFGELQSTLRQQLRAAYRRLKGKQVNTGFYTAFLGLLAALEHIGCDVRVNDFALARKMPGYPVGIAGYPSVLDKIGSLRNPKLFGPGDPGYPDEASRVSAGGEVDLMIQPSQWYVDFYQAYCGDKVVRWPVGIDLDGIVDASDAPKDLDVLIYDKVRWNRETVVPRVNGRLVGELDRRGLSHATLRYGDHTQQDYFAHLRRARSMAFICEHETQGLACEEALAMNIPVFAWDEGRLCDPRQHPFEKPGLTVSSVPYFDDRCGTRFTTADLEASLGLFWKRLPDFQPRAYVAEALGLEKSGHDYLALLRSIL